MNIEARINKKKKFFVKTISDFFDNILYSNHSFDKNLDTLRLTLELDPNMKANQNDIEFINYQMSHRI